MQGKAFALPLKRTTGCKGDGNSPCTVYWGKANVEQGILNIEYRSEKQKPHHSLLYTIRFRRLKNNLQWAVATAHYVVLKRIGIGFGFELRYSIFLVRYSIFALLNFNILFTLISGILGITASLTIALILPTRNNRPEVLKGYSLS